MSKLSTITRVTLAAVAALSIGSAFAAEPQKTREQVIAELQQARADGEVAALSAEQAGVGALNNGVNAPTASQIAAKKAADKAAVAKAKAGNTADSAAAAK